MGAAVTLCFVATTLRVLSGKLRYAVRVIVGQAALAFLAHAGGRISNLFDDALQSFASDSKVLAPVFNFSFVLHGNLAAVGSR